MATIEKNALLSVKDVRGDLVLLYPVTNSDSVMCEDGSTLDQKLNELGGGSSTEDIEELNQQLSSLLTTVETLSSKVSTMESQMASIDKVYPVGSIYMSMSETDPGTLFGGAWTRLPDKFLIGAGGSYSVGATGGEADHTLTLSEIPSHSHSVSGSTSSSGNHRHEPQNGNSFVTADSPSDGFNRVNCTFGGSNTRTVIEANDSGIQSSGWYTDYAGSHSHSLSASIGSTGSGAAHNNMPPYLAVYMWQRTS